jgi:tRNA pseudouridine38-40 synthase
MAHYKLILAYDGTNYNGFQRQAIKTSVQATFEEALRRLGWQGRAIMPSGRTDSGVHAKGQVVSFNFDWNHPDFALQNALNAFLPADIAVQSVQQVAAEFHPRYDALSRQYRYQLYWQSARDPLRDRFSWRLERKPEIQLMQTAANDLLGEHNFIAFGKALKEDGTTTRRIFSADWVEEKDGMSFTIVGNAFLYHMVRRIVYVLVRIGLGELPVETVRLGLELGSTGIVDLAPARGLSLEAVIFNEDK